MMPASTTGGGQCLGVPDVCKTPSPAGPVPIPYPNIAQLAQATKSSTKVKFVQCPALTKKSEVPMTQGDEAGVSGGVVSGKNMDKMTFQKGSMKVKVEGQPVTCLTAMTAHNGASANMPAGSQIAPSQTKVLVAP